MTGQMEGQLEKHLKEEISPVVCRLLQLDLQTAGICICRGLSDCGQFGDEGRKSFFGRQNHF